MTDQEKRTTVNTATINFAKSVRNNTISKVIDVIQTAGSSTATEPVLLDPQLTLETEIITVYNDSSSEVSVSFLGEGEITISDDYGGSYSYAHGRHLLIIQGTPNNTNGTITVSLSAAGNYAAATATIAVLIGEEAIA